MKKRENETTKTCCVCGENKSLELFHRETKGVLGRQGRCKDCHKTAQRQYNSRKPEKILIFNLRRMGLTITEYQQMFDSQNGLCAVCHQPENRVDKRTGAIMRLAIDHDHSCCGKRKACKNCIRRLLCQSCNHALGLLQENPGRIRNLADYAEKNPKFFVPDLDTPPV